MRGASTAYLSTDRWRPTCAEVADCPFVGANPQALFSADVHPTDLHQNIMDAAASIYC